jgi:hypothetical protein
MPLAADLESALREFAAAGPAELRDNGARVAPLSTRSWEVRGNSEKPQLHLWSGRLAILELKANEDPDFLLQAAKYWLRIRQHLEQQDFPTDIFRAGRCNPIPRSCIWLPRRCVFI